MHSPFVTFSLSKKTVAFAFTNRRDPCCSISGSLFGNDCRRCGVHEKPPIIGYVRGKGGKRETCKLRKRRGEIGRRAGLVHIAVRGVAVRKTSRHRAGIGSPYSNESFAILLLFYTLLINDTDFFSYCSTESSIAITGPRCSADCWLLVCSPDLLLPVP